MTNNRGDTLQSHKVRFARSDVENQVKDLVDVIHYVKPNVLIGLSGIGGKFNQEVRVSDRETRVGGDATA